MMSKIIRRQKGMNIEQNDIKEVVSPDTNDVERSDRARGLGKKCSTELLERGEDDLRKRSPYHFEKERATELEVWEKNAQRNCLREGRMIYARGRHIILRRSAQQSSRCPEKRRRRGSQAKLR